MTAAAAGSIPALAALYVGQMTFALWESVSRYGWGFVTGTVWDPVFEEYGALPFIWGTLVSSLLWLVLFGNSLQNIARGEVPGGNYLAFMTASAFVMTVFNGGMNGGLEILFDRETGVFERLLASPSCSPPDPEAPRTGEVARRIDGAVPCGSLLGSTISTGVPNF